MLSKIFGKRAVKTKTLNLGQVEVVIELYSGQTIKKTIKGIYDEDFDGYSPAEHRLSYFMDKVKRENVLEIMTGHFVNVSQEIKSVTHGKINPLTIEVKVD